MKNKKVIFCNNVLGGQLHFRKEVMENFTSRDWEVVIIVSKESINECLLTELNPKWKLYALDVNRNGKNLFRDLKYFYDLRNIYERERPDIIFHYTIKPNIYGTIAAKSLHLKSVAMVAGLGYMFNGNSITKRIGRLLYKIGLRKSSKVIVLNSRDKEILLKGNFVKDDKLIHFKGGEGVNMEKYRYSEMNFNKVRFLMIARVLYDKGYQEYVDAAKIVKNKYPNIEVELLGPLASDSPMGVPEEIVKRDNDMGYIQYLGETNNILPYVLRDDVVIVVASKYLEGLNRSLMEACSMGRPVITTSNPGCKEAVDDSINGYIVEPGNTNDLADAMLKMIESSREKKLLMSQASLKKAKECFDLKGVINEYWNIVKELT